MKPDFDCWREAVIQLLFPCCRCILCSRPGETDKRGLCRYCTEELENIRAGYAPCRCCATFIPREENICADCTSPRQYLWFDRARAAFPYQGIIKESIRRFKYRGAVRLDKPLGEMMLDALKKEGYFGEIDGVIPVPLHPDRLKERGYNQSELLARVIAGGLNLHLLTDLLSRRVHTPSQTGLNKKERSRNLAGAFTLSRKYGICQKRLLIVDDIYTTGATVNACAQILKEGGAREIYIISCAAGKQQ